MRLLALLLVYVPASYVSAPMLSCSALKEDRFSSTFGENYIAEVLSEHGWKGVETLKERKFFTNDKNQKIETIRYKILHSVIEKQMAFHRELILLLKDEPFFPYEAECFQHEEWGYLAFKIPSNPYLFYTYDLVPEVDKFRAIFGKLVAIFRKLEECKAALLAVDEMTFFQLADGWPGLNPEKLAHVYPVRGDAYCAGQHWLMRTMLHTQRPTDAKNAWGLSQVIIVVPPTAHKQSLVRLLKKLAGQTLLLGQDTHPSEELQRYARDIFVFCVKLMADPTADFEWEKLQNLIAGKEGRRSPVFSGREARSREGSRSRSLSGTERRSVSATRSVRTSSSSPKKKEGESPRTRSKTLHERSNSKEQLK